MSRLIDELKKEHAAIIATLTKVRSLGVISDEGQQVLFSVKDALLAHLKKEDERLYPALNAAAKNNAGLKQTLKMFASDMEGISAGVLDFFDKYSAGSTGMEFAEDSGKLFAILSQRISSEESIIYTKYDELDRK